MTRCVNVYVCVHMHTHDRVCAWGAPVFAYLHMFTCLGLPPFLPILSLLSSLILSLLLFPSLSQTLLATLIYMSSFAHVCELRYQQLILGCVFLSLLSVEWWPFIQCWTQGPRIGGTDKPTLGGSLRLVSCGSASLSSLSVGAGSTAVGRARGLFSLTPLELDTGIHPRSQGFLPWSLCAVGSQCLPPR